jgi:hypothetical protein
VNGLNFTPTTTVLWDHSTSLTTTYVSATVLQAQVPASLIGKPGAALIVPSPLGTFNFGSTFTVSVPPLTGNGSYSLSTVPVRANDMVWDPASQRLYLSVMNQNGTNPNMITALNPQTGLFGSSVTAGSEPGKLAVSSDGTYIYAGLNSTGSVHRYTLPSLQSDIDIPLGASSYGPYYAIDLAVHPSNARSVAVTRGVSNISPREIGGTLLYDDAVARPLSVPGFGAGSGNTIDSLLWNPNGQSLYGIDTVLYMMSVSSAGIQLQTKTLAGGGYNLHFDSTTGYLYSDTGNVIDPGTGAIIASFPLNTVQGGFNGNSIMVPDGKLNIAYFVGQPVYGKGSGNYAIAAFDLTRFTLLGAIPVNISGTPARIVRWGNNGLAFLTTDPSLVSAPADGVYLVSGAFVTSPTP